MIQHLSTLLAVFDDRGLQIVGLLLAWATVLLGAAWLISRLLRSASASVRYCVWQYALLGLLAAPGAFALLPGIPLGLSLVRARPELPKRALPPQPTTSARRARRCSIPLPAVVRLGPSRQPIWRGGVFP